MPAKKGSQNALKHGGAGAEKAISEGKPFRGLAAKTQAEVKADLYDEGRPAMVEELATRLHTAARLYWGAIDKVVDEASAGDANALRLFDNYVKRFGWLAGAALRAWAQVKQEDAAQPPALDYDELVAQLRKDKETDERPDD
jgi:hypothetical protein